MCDTSKLISRLAELELTTTQRDMLVDMLMAGDGVRDVFKWWSRVGYSIQQHNFDRIVNTYLGLAQPGEPPQPPQQDLPRDQRGTQLTVSTNDPFKVVDRLAEIDLTTAQRDRLIDMATEGKDLKDVFLFGSRDISRRNFDLFLNKYLGLRQIDDD